jgi:pimeloyl-ACP methyl ester carboxylesterase
MFPGSPFALSWILDPRRYSDPAYLRRVAPALYGGEIRRDPSLLDDYVRVVKQPPFVGYLHQQLALTGWTSLFWLPALRQPTLVVAGNDDPLVPLANARVLAGLIPRAKLHVVDDGHLFLVTRSQRATPVIRSFLSAPSQDA